MDEKEAKEYFYELDLKQNKCEHMDVSNYNGICICKFCGKIIDNIYVENRG